MDGTTINRDILGLKTSSPYYCLPSNIYQQKITAPVTIKAETHNYNKQSKH